MFKFIRVYVGVLFVLSALLIAPISSRAQVLYGSVTGSVSDPKGDAVPGAKVDVVETTTGAMKSTTTDDRGAYTISDLKAGVYKITITRSGFKTELRDDVRVEANKTLRVDADLQLGEMKETVVVTAGQEGALQTDRADVNVTMQNPAINNLPLFGSVGRNYQSLLYLIPGTTRGTGGFFINGSGTEDNSAAGNPQRSMSFNVNGVSRLQNNQKIDGSSIIYPWLPANTLYVPPSEAIQEVNIVTNAFDAEQGLAGGAAVNVSIKTGGNDFHGVGWGYDTNSAFQSRRFFQPVNQPQIPKNILAQFGYAVSGPVYLPKIFNGKNKLFFFT